MILNMRAVWPGQKGKKGGFTLVELLVVISIISLLSSIVFSSISSARSKARDARRITDMKQITTALYLYYDKNGFYPANTDNDCGGWDIGKNGGSGSADPFISLLAEFLPITPADPVTTSSCGGYRYYRYPAGTAGCDSSKGAFYVLGVPNMETSGNPHPISPGWSCPSRNWQNEMEWVTGAFEN